MTASPAPIVFITGASSGIGAACADAFAAGGYRLLVAARRLGRLEAASGRWKERGAAEVRCLELDVRDASAVNRAIEGLPEAWSSIEVLVNNAGLSRGLASLQDGEQRDWEEMIDTNLKGLLFVNRAVVPGMVRRRRGTVVHIGSIAGHETYPKGNVYCATKHAVRSINTGLRLDLNGTGVRALSIDPGMVDTEFSEVRFRGDEARARQVYAGTHPLGAADVADVVYFAATRPPHVNLAEVLLLPTAQASATLVHRES